ncbi:MAG: tRNA (adenosine(37)-N6)-threonylcarbamoyltransferase complex ATPase subunit type 1 TsaE [Pyramidobacter sp.]|nr:tRNA (adenosine(37)-N6)-threonylcarbamoyltransferase complex ATPase subunit type 1 TsaE [Pyramidobacter sp.]
MRITQNCDGSAAFELNDLCDTETLGAAIADSLLPGMTLLLEGDLGAGKTTLVRSICRALGWKKTCSPSFALVNEYARARIPIAHADLYRIEHADGRDFGFDDYLDEGWVLIVEWSERLVRHDFPEVWQCRMDTVSDGGRAFTVLPKGDKAAEALKRLEMLLA